MAAANVVDLDALAPLDRRVKLGNREWKVPGDPPVGWMLAFQQLVAQIENSDDDVDQIQVLEDVRDTIVDLLVMRHPDESDEAVDAANSIGVGTLIQAFVSLYAPPAVEEPDAPVRPRSAGTKKKPNTTRAKPTGSASRSSRSART